MPNLYDLTKANQKYVAVTYIRQGSYADQMALDNGELLTSVDDKEVNCLEDVVEILQNKAKGKDKGQHVVFQSHSGGIGCFELREDDLKDVVIRPFANAVT